MKIVFIGRYNQSERLTGPEKFAKRLFSHFLHSNCDINFIEYFFKYEKKKSNTFLRLFGKQRDSKNQYILRLGMLRLFLYLVKEQPDIIHIVTSERFIITLFLYKFLLKGKIVVTKHSILREEFTRHTIKDSLIGKHKDLIQEWMEFTYCDWIFCFSQDEINIAKSYYKIDESKTTIINNGIDIEFFKARTTSRGANNIGIVFYNGFDFRIDRGLNDLVEALNKIKNPELLNFFVLGEMSDTIRSKAKFQIMTHPIVEQNRLIDFLRDKQIILKSHTVDTFPILVGECMSMGLVPIISDNVGFKRFIVNGKNGFVYKTKDFSELVEALELLINDENLLKELSKNVRLIYHKLKWENIAEDYLNNYKFIAV